MGNGLAGLGLPGPSTPLVLDLGGGNFLDGAVPGEGGGGCRVVGPTASEDKAHSHSPGAWPQQLPPRDGKLMGSSEGPGVP